MDTLNEVTPHLMTPNTLLCLSTTIVAIAAIYAAVKLAAIFVFVPEFEELPEEVEELFVPAVKGEEEEEEEEDDEEEEVEEDEVPPKKKKARARDKLGITKRRSARLAAKEEALDDE